MNLTFALAGNQNCGKTTLFNQLTGSHQHVGNFPGVTVERKEGAIRGHAGASVVDLPGIYSLSPYTSEEVVTRDFLLRDKPDAIINILDATNIERNLYLTLQLMELQIPMILALNMMDEVRSAGGTVDVLALSEALGVEVVPIVASKNEGVHELIDRAIRVATEKRTPNKLDFCVGEVHKAIHAISHIIEDHAAERGIPTRFAATKLVEGDAPMLEALHIHEGDIEIIRHIVEDMETALGTDREAALADMRYDYIGRLCAKTVHKPRETREQARSHKIDAVLTHRIFAIPIFLGIMFTVFWLTFSVIGNTLSDWLGLGIDALIALVDRGLTAASINPVIHSLIVDGALAGVGSVLSFLPIIVTLFFFLSLLEDSGYMARVAFVMDQLLRKIGLSGRSFVPMLIGFGCSVPAIMATRTLPGERDRKMTIMLTPFMSCSAKLPIYAVFTAAFFPRHGALVMFALYGGGVLMAILSALVLSKTAFTGKAVPFVMELPAYRLPGVKSSLLHMWQKARDFFVKAFTIIFVASVVVWVLQTLDFGLNLVSDPSHSMLAAIGRLVAPVFAPLGFGSWQAVAALVTGLGAKEAVVSTFGQLLGAGSPASLASLLPQIFSPLSAASFLTFTLLYSPCVAAVAAVRREMGGLGKALLVMLFQTSVAYVAALAVHLVGSLLI